MLAGVARRAVGRRFERVTEGDRSQVSWWRLRPYADNTLVVGVDSIIDTRIVFERAGAEVVIGNRTFLGRGIVTVADKLEIGDDVMVAWGVTITDHNSHSLRFSERAADVQNWRQGKKEWTGIRVSPVRIGDKAWVGLNAIVLRGVNVGEGAIVGAGSVVTKDVPAWSVVAGNPARVVREIPPGER